MNWYKKAQLNINIPKVLYHATFKNNLESIKQRGLLPNFDGIVKCWEDCKNGVYLHKNADVAASYVEAVDNPGIPNEWIETESNIVVLEIDTSNLNKNLFEFDPNLRDELRYDSFLYIGNIPFNAVNNIL
jgi:hypothetical protein